jgi:N-acetylmuramoyl-L-alanine amidase
MEYRRLSLEKVTNGVRGFNVESIHISYVGGVDPNDHTKALDTRTEAQKSSIERCIVEAINWLREQGRDVSKDLMVLGHREFSADQNRNGVIEAWERIKECPSFDAMFEYNAVFGSANNKLPHNR